MKKITCFTANLASGGAEHQMAILCNLLSEYGYEITLVTYNDLPDEYKLGRDIKRVRLNLSGNSLCKELKVFRYFLKVDTDCIISYRSTPNFMVSMPLLLRRGIKLICGERNTTVKPNKMELMNYNLLYYRTNYVVPNSYTQAEYLKGLNKAWGKRVVPITNYTALDEFIPTPLPSNSDKMLLIGVFARIFPQKNYERLCKVLSLLKNRTDRKFKLVWYGEREDMEHAKGSEHIHQLIENLNIDDVLDVRPSVVDVVGKMQQFHVMCLPSLYEGFSNSLAEYICCGKPVVCSDVSDNSIMVHHGENGFLFDPKDEESICSAFLQLFALNEEQLFEMGRKSRMISECIFDKSKFVNSYIDLIEN